MSVLSWCRPKHQLNVSDPHPQALAPLGFNATTDIPTLAEFLSYSMYGDDVSILPVGRHTLTMLNGQTAELRKWVGRKLKLRSASWESCMALRFPSGFPLAFVCAGPLALHGLGLGRAPGPGCQ